MPYSVRQLPRLEYTLSVFLHSLLGKGGGGMERQTGMERRGGKGVMEGKGKGMGVGKGREHEGGATKNDGLWSVPTTGT